MCQPRSWLIFDVGHNMTPKEHKWMSACMVGATLGVGVWIVASQPNEWLASSLFFSGLAVALWCGLKVKRDALAKIVRIDDRSANSDKQQRF